MKISLNSQKIKYDSPRTNRGKIMLFIFLEIVIVGIACGGVATLARGRGASAELAGGIAAGGYIIFRLSTLFLWPDWVELMYPAMLLGWAWIGAVTLFVRFVIGAGLPKPDSRWNCPDCRYLNNQSAVVCEACRRPWAAAARSGE